MTPFSIARLPRIEFGCGTIERVPELVAGFGSRVLLVTGAHSFQAAPQWDQLRSQFRQRSIAWEQVNVAGEPSPQLVDEAVAAHADGNFDVVLGIGGGSALDAAKAIAGLLRVGRSVMDYLEGVGPELSYSGPAVPLVAVPTTAGTGSEATKNAVLSIHGPDGFKKSFRHDILVAEYAVVDPDLLASCPPAVIAANGMDALTQVLESYVSTGANSFTDALGLDALRAVREGLLPLFQSAGVDAVARERMAWASLVSGINLAQTGLGSVHGLASPLGAYYPIPHGVVCGTLVAAATRMNLDALRARDPDGPALARYARAGSVLSGHHHPRDEACEVLVSILEDWTRQMDLAPLSRYGLDESSLDQVVANARGGSMKSNPIVLTDAELRTVLEQRL